MVWVLVRERPPVYRHVGFRGGRVLAECAAGLDGDVVTAQRLDGDPGQLEGVEDLVVAQRIAEGDIENPILDVVCEQVIDAKSILTLSLIHI